MIKCFKILTQGRFHSISSSSIEADRNKNDLFTGSNSIKLSMQMVVNKLKIYHSLQNFGLKKVVHVKNVKRRILAG